MVCVNPGYVPSPPQAALPGGVPAVGEPKQGRNVLQDVINKLEKFYGVSIQDCHLSLHVSNLDFIQARRVLRVVSYW